MQIYCAAALLASCRVTASGNCDVHWRELKPAHSSQLTRGNSAAPNTDCTQLFSELKWMPIPNLKWPSPPGIMSHLWPFGVQRLRVPYGLVPVDNTSSCADSRSHSVCTQWTANCNSRCGKIPELRTQYRCTSAVKRTHLLTVIVLGL